MIPDEKLEYIAEEYLAAGGLEGHGISFQVYVAGYLYKRETLIQELAKEERYVEV